MAKFTVTFERTVITTETVERVIEAEDQMAAYARAGDMVEEFNRSCPDDLRETGFDCQSWGWTGASRAPDDAEIDD